MTRRLALLLCLTLITAPAWPAAKTKFNVSGTNLGTISASVTGTRTVTVQDATHTLVGKDTTDTLTNKTLDVEDTGNAITIIVQRFLQPIQMFNVIAYYNVNGSTDQPGLGAAGQSNNWPDLERLQFDASSAEEVAYMTNFPTDTDLSAGVDITLFWGPTAGSCGSNCGVRFCVKVACSTPTSDSWDLGANQGSNSCNTLTASTTATFLQTSTHSSVDVSGCVAGDVVYISVFRQAANLLDTYASDAALYGINLAFRRTE